MDIKLWWTHPQPDNPSHIVDEAVRLTTNHSMSSYHQAVVVTEDDNIAHGPAEVDGYLHLVPGANYTADEIEELREFAAREDSKSPRYEHRPFGHTNLAYHFGADIVGLTYGAKARKDAQDMHS